jgi:sortase A
MTRIRPGVAGGVALAASLLVSGCGGGGAEAEGQGSQPGQPRPTSTSSLPDRSASSTPSPTQSPSPPGRTPAAAARREPLRSYLTVPTLGIRDVPVVRYRGRPDDAAGTRIQNRGPAASPRGPRGGVGPGEVGNFLVTGHRTSHAAPFAELPSLERGDEVHVRSGRTVHVYEVTRTRSTSFRSEVSRSRQEAPVPGRPGATPTRAMITLSTCATPEDHAAGNYWADRFGNPEHRIDKIGVLVDVRRS